MLLIRDIDNRSLVLTYKRVSTGCQCNYELTLKTRFWSKAKRGPYFSFYVKASSVLFFSRFLSDQNNNNNDKDTESFIVKKCSCILCSTCLFRTVHTGETDGD